MTGKLPTASRETADVLLFFDKLFDSVNGNFDGGKKVKNGKIYRTALKNKSPHHKLWMKSLPILKSMKFINKQGKKIMVPSINSWIRTIEAFQKIYRNVKQLGVSSLLLRHFNQDPLENFFGAVRSLGQRNNNPNASSFQSAYKTLLINNITSAQSVCMNCQKDDFHCLQNLRYFFEFGNLNKTDENIMLDEDDLFMDEINTDRLITSKDPVDVERCAAIAYCSGWLVKVAKTTITKKCLTCKYNLESQSICQFHEFIKISEYSDKGWLAYPTREIFDCFCQVENITTLVISRTPQRPNIASYIKLIVSTNLDFNFLTCNEHKQNLINFLVNKLVLFCIRNYCKEVNSIMLGKGLCFDRGDETKLNAEKYYLKFINRNKSVNK